MPGSPPTTPNTAIPRIANTDDFDIATDLNAVSDRVDALWSAVGTFASRPAASGTLNGLRYTATDKGMTWQMVAGAWVLVAAIPVVSATPPSGPQDRQLWEFDASGIAIGASNTGSNLGIRWLFRYDSGTSKWQFVGGESVRADVLTSGTLGSLGVWADLPGIVGPRITIPSWGVPSDWAVQYGAHVQPSTNSVSVSLGVAIGAANPATDAVSSVQVPSALNTTIPAWAEARVDAVASAGELRLRYNSSTGAPNFTSRRLRARPIRVG